MTEHAYASTSDPTGLLGAGPPANTLVRLAEQAASCVPASCGVATTVSIDGLPEPEPPTGVTHPDLARLVSVQWKSGDGPIPAAVRSQKPAASDDLLAEHRWPAYRAMALDAGVRASSTLPFRHDGVTVTVTICGFRPGLMDATTRTATSLIGDLATHMLVRDRRYEEALTEVDELDTAIRTRPVIDQASGILMHVLGCGADAAFDVLRRQSQRTNRKLSELAQDMVSSRGQGIDTALARVPRERD